MTSKRGWWTLKVEIWNDAGDKIYTPNEADLEHIAQAIKDGCTQGEIVHEEEG